VTCLKEQSTNRTRCVSALLITGALALPAKGADLAKIDRTLAKEPAYKGTPTYCLLVFGAGARTRVWLVRDGDTLYVDRNGNGDLTDKGESLAGTRYPDGVKWQIGDITEADGKTRHTDLRVWFWRGSSYTVHLRTASGLHQEVGNEIGRLRFAGRARDAPIVHLAGPLTFLLPENRERRLEFIPGEEAHFIALLGTPGLGNGAAAYGYAEDFAKPGVARMVVEADFPGRARGTTVRVRNVCTYF
jgi:hypothetical protein